MGNATKDWWASARQMLYRYPRIAKDREDLHQQNVTADLSGMPRGGGAGRTTETIAMRQLPPAEEKEYQDVSSALRMTRLLPDGESKVKLIELMYFKHGGIKMEYAAYRVHISYSTARRWHKDFINLIGKIHGWTA